VLEAMLPAVEKAWGSVARARCVACHSPGHGGDATIGCVSCHAAVGNRGEGNGALVVDLQAPLAGPEGHQTSAHRTTSRGFLTSASLCGTCHEVHGPGLLEEPTLTEFRAAPFGDSCLSCHGEGDHRFVGLDPPWGASADEAAIAAAASRELLSRALLLEVVRGESGVVVRLTNEKTGHAVPTGITALRDVWVDVELTDASGVHSQRPRVLELSSRMMRDEVEVALPTEATRIESRALAWGASREYPLEVPADVAVVARLRARAVRGSTLTALGLEERAAEVPTLDVQTVRLP
jgi:hypothetical protein